MGVTVGIGVEVGIGVKVGVCVAVGGMGVAVGTGAAVGGVVGVTVGSSGTTIAAMEVAVGGVLFWQPQSAKPIIKRVRRVQTFIDITELGRWPKRDSFPVQLDVGYWFRRCS